MIEGPGGLGGWRTGRDYPKEFWDESWRLEETCCHSNSENRSANTDVKNSKGVNNNNNNNTKRKRLQLWN